MGFFNYVKAASKFKDNAYVLETIKRLKDFDEFHCLRDSSLLLAGKIDQIIGKAPEEYIKWMSVCNGGMLFDTTLLSIDSQDTQLGIEFSSLEEYNDFSGMQEFMLPPGYSVIAMGILSVFLKQMPEFIYGIVSRGILLISGILFMIFLRMKSTLHWN